MRRRGFAKLSRSILSQNVPIGKLGHQASMKSVSPTELDESVDGNCFRSSPFDWTIDIEEPLDRLGSAGNAASPVPSEVEESFERANSASEVRKGSSGGKSFRRKKKPKGLPKRPLSSYNIYFQAERSKIVRENDLERASQESVAKLTFEELGKIIGKRWKALSDVERKQYDLLADEEGERYRKEMDTFNEAKRRKRAESANLDRPHVLTFPKVSMDTGATESELSSHEPPLIPPSLSAFPVPPSTPIKARLPGCDGRVDASLSLKPTASDLRVSSLQAGQPEMAHQIVGWNSYQGQQTCSWLPPPAVRNVSSAFTEPMHALTHQSPNNAVSPNSKSPVDSTSAHPDIPLFHPLSRSLREPQPYLPVPPGMAIFLPDSSGQDRKYVVTYNFYSMSRREAEDYMKSLESSARGASGVAATMPPCPRQEMPTSHPPT